MDSKHGVRGNEVAIAFIAVSYWKTPVGPFSFRQDCKQCWSDSSKAFLKFRFVLLVSADDL